MVRCRSSSCRRGAAAAAWVWLAGAACLPAAFAAWPDERTVGAFVCHADFSLAPYHDLLAQTRQLQDELAATLQLAPPREPMHLFLFSRQSTYERYVRRYLPGAPDRRALFVKGAGPGMVFAHLSRDVQTDLRHECTHAVLHASLPVVPLWLDEGLAEYFETPPESRATDSPHLRSVRWRALLGWAPNLERLERLGRVEQMGEAEYRDAWAVVHFLLHGPPPARETLFQFLGDLEASRPPGTLSERLRGAVPQLERRLIEHFRNWP